MATETPQTLEELTSRGKPRSGAQKDTTMFWIGISFAMHLTLLVATSYGYIYDHYIDPVGYQQRLDAAKKAEEIAATQKSPEQAHSAGPTAPGTPATPATGVKPDAAGAGGEATTKPDPLHLNDKAPAPKNPDDLGLDISETNKHS